MAATIPRAALDFLTEEVNGISADAQARVLKVLQGINWTPENVAECRDLVIQALDAVMPTYTDAAAQAGADLYDAVRESAVGEAMGARAISGYEPDATEGAVRAFVQDIVNGKPVEAFNAKVLDRVDRDIRRAENVSVAENAARDPLKPRYARVPSGSETCGFCLMLASRGFVYKTAEAASHAHAGCDCRVVPGFPGMEVDGYDPDELYNRWQLALAGKEHQFRTGSGSGNEPFPPIRGEHSIEDDLAATNPNYSRGGVEWRANCQRCVGAYEMRRRGFDVTVKPRPTVNGKPDYSNDELPNRLSPNGWPHMFENPDLESIAGTSGNAVRNRIVQRMREYGDGSRAIIRVQWKRQYGGGGHVFIAEQVDGETRFIDPQSSSPDCSRYFSMIAKGQTEILRVDDKKTTDLIGEAVENVS